MKQAKKQPDITYGDFTAKVIKMPLLIKISVIL